MANNINLSNVNITIQQFQSISDGEYNVGEVTLENETTLGKINHHVTFKGSNDKTQSHEQVLAVKDAFIRALSQSGVDINEINRVRAELGLAPEGHADTTLVHRNIRPLTRQQVRDILDRYADTINATRGAGTIRTHAEIYTRYDDEGRAQLARTRKQLNAELAQRRTIQHDQRITDIQTVIGGSVHFASGDERERLITVAERLKARILQRSHGNPSNEPNATMRYTRHDSGLSVTFSLGMSEADFIKKLDDMLAVMLGNRRPNEATVAVRREMRTALAEGHAAVANWLGALLGDPQGAFKARTIAVGLLLDGGIDDWETLSLVNRISDDNAMALVVHLANSVVAGQMLKGDALRQSPAVAALAGQALAQPVHAERQAYIPALSPREANLCARDGFASNGPIQRVERTISHEMKTLRAGIMDEMRARFGADLLPQRVSFAALVSVADIDDAFDMDETGDVRKTAADVRASLVSAAERDMARRFLVSVLKPMLQATGNEVEAASVATRLLVRHPQLKAQLVAAQSPEEANAIIDDFRAEIEAGVRRLVATKRGVADAAARYRAAIAGELGIPVESLQGRTIDMSFLSGKCRALAYDIESGVNPADTDQEIEQVFRVLATHVAEERIALLRQIDELNVMAETRDILKAQVLSLRKVTGFDFVAFKATADQFNIGNLTTVLSLPVSTQSVVHEMSLVGTASANAAVAFCQGQGLGGEVGGDEVGAVSNLLVTLALDREPGAIDLVRGFFARPDVANTNLVNIEGGIAPRSIAFEMFRPEMPVGEANAAIADSVGRPNMAPIHALAMRLAFDDVGLGNLSADEKANLLRGEVGTTLANQVRGAATQVTPSLLRAIARAALAETAVKAAAKPLLGQLAQLCGIQASAQTISKAMDIILRRDPTLMPRLKDALSRAATFGQDPASAVDKALAPFYNDVAVVLGAIHDVETVNATALDSAAAQIAERANLDAADVRAKLNVGDVTIETNGSLTAFRDSVLAALANPATDLAAFSMDAFRQDADARIEEFVAKKVESIAQIDAMQIPQATKGSLIALVLERPSFSDPELVAAARQICASPEVGAAFELARNTFTVGKVASLPREVLFEVVTSIAKCFNNAIAAAVPEAKRNSMGAAGYNVLRSILGAALAGHCGATFIAALEKIAATGVGLNVFHILNDHSNESAQVKDAVRGLADAFILALDDEWLPAELASAVHPEQGAAPDRLRDQANALVGRAPGLVARYSQGLDEAQRAELKALAVTLDYRNHKLDQAESAIRAKAASFALDDAGFAEADSAAAAKALEMGYNRGDLAMLQRVADLYREATGCTVREAQIAALDCYSPAHQLFGYGGRFVASVENFRKGLALIGKFREWFAATTAQIATKSAAGFRMPADASPTMLNSDTSYFSHDTEYAYQKFVFEHLAADESLPIEAEDAKTLFDMEHCTVTRFFGRAYSNSATNTMAQIPPARRAAVYAVFDMLAPLADTQAGVSANIQSGGLSALLVARVMKHYDEVAAMLAAGTLNKRTFCERFLADVPGAADMTIKQISDAFTMRLTGEICQGRFQGNFDKILQVQQIAQTSGSTLDECTDVVANGGTLPFAPFIASANGGISELGSMRAGRGQCVLDLLRPANPLNTATNANVFTVADNVFTVVFPDGTTLKSSSDAQAEAIAEKVAEFCGPVHPEQLNSLYFALSQSAAAGVNRAFLDHNIATSEHMPLTYTLSKNDETGAITVRYSEPEGFPVRFHWDSVIDLTGFSESTPMVIE